VPQATLDAMAAERVVGTYLLQEYRAAAEDLWKAWAMPYPEAEAQMMRSWRALSPDQPPAPDNPMIQLLLVDIRAAGKPDYRRPVLVNARFQLSQVDRRIAMLRTVEALRDHAARHDGRPPARLDEVTELRVPGDLVTGKPFGYRLEGRTAILEAAAPPTRSESSGVRFELTFAP
jgi:hypothetical protein